MPGSADSASTAPDKPLSPAWNCFFNFLGQDGFHDLKHQTATLQRQIRDNGVTYNVYADANGPQRPWSLDLFPMLISPQDWCQIEAGIQQRARLLAAASRGIDHAGVDEAPRRVVRIAEVRHVSRPLDRAGEGGGHVEVVRFGERELLHACAVVRCRLRIFRERRRAHDDAFRAHRRGEPPNDVGRARAADDSIFGNALGTR